MKVKTGTWKLLPMIRFLPKILILLIQFIRNCLCAVVFWQSPVRLTVNIILYKWKWRFSPVHSSTLPLLEYDSLVRPRFSLVQPRRLWPHDNCLHLAFPPLHLHQVRDLFRWKLEWVQHATLRRVCRLKTRGSENGHRWGSSWFLLKVAFRSWFKYSIFTQLKWMLQSATLPVASTSACYSSTSSASSSAPTLSLSLLVSTTWSGQTPPMIFVKNFIPQLPRINITLIISLLTAKTILMIAFIHNFNTMTSERKGQDRKKTKNLSFSIFWVLHLEMDDRH